MEVIINDKAVSLTNGQELSSALNIVGIDNTSGIAVALNNQVIPRKEWENTKLNNADKITVISATAGG